MLSGQLANGWLSIRSQDRNIHKPQKRCHTKNEEVKQNSSHKKKRDRIHRTTIRLTTIMSSTGNRPVMTVDSTQQDAAVSKAEIPKDFFPHKQSIDRNWAKTHYKYRHILNAAAVRMYTSEKELQDFIKEGNTVARSARKTAWVKFQEAAMVTIAANPHWKILMNGTQTVTNMTEVSEVVTTKEWIESLPSATVDDALATISVAMFIDHQGASNWVRKAEEAVLLSLGVSGYCEGGGKGKGNLRKLIKSSVAERWKKLMAAKMEKRLGWTVGSRKGKNDEGRCTYENMSTKGGYVAYRVTRWSDYDQQGLDGTRERAKNSLRDFVREGGTREQMEEMVEEALTTGELSQNDMKSND